MTQSKQIAVHSIGCNWTFVLFVMSEQPPSRLRLSSLKLHSNVSVLASRNRFSCLGNYEIHAKNILWRSHSLRCDEFAHEVDPFDNLSRVKLWIFLRNLNPDLQFVIVSAIISSMKQNSSFLFELSNGSHPIQTSNVIMITRFNVCRLKRHVITSNDSFHSFVLS